MPVRTLRVIEGLAPGNRKRRGLGWRQERFDALPEFVAEQVAWPWEILQTGDSSMA